ncbi:transmembrane and coiled-coil domain-containing protein 3 isoform X1 [Poecile atricapillus]|uniref:transmembrane and coiled-coil domain-containing protein 3 isoform X1 n=2 Tax=Neoaves TaxID=3078114 RepID=UPI002738CBBC|nr:transmembrane and coiled-coil domain-containing protein 3 isoform X1 [Poecile atricapillus]
MKATGFISLWTLVSLPCGPLANPAEREDVVKHAIKLHRGKGAVITQRKQWVLESCRKLSGLLRQKNVVLNKLKNAIRAVEKDAGLSDEEKLFQVHTFEIFQKELNESENSVFQAIHGLQRALQGDYKDVVNMKESSRQRLEALREAAIKRPDKTLSVCCKIQQEEMEYVELLAAEKHQVEALKNMQHQNKSLSMLDEILEDVRKAADRLEEEIEEHAFDDNKSQCSNREKAKAAFLFGGCAAPGSGRAGPGRRERPLLSRREEQPCPSRSRLCTWALPQRQRSLLLPAAPCSSACSSTRERRAIIKCNLEDCVLPHHCKEHHFKLKQWDFGIENFNTVINILKKVRGVNFEAVLRVEEDEANSKRNASKREVEDDLGLSMLIDSQNNQYILTKPRDSTIPRADHHFIKDIVTIGMLSLPCGWLCTTIGLPTMFGYIICGVLLGPSGLNSIKSIVQVETLGEFGVFFTLFLVGLEFSPERLRKVWKISLQGPCYMTVLMIAFGLLWGHLLQIRPTQSVFISTCLSLSSTPLVSRFLAGSVRGDKEGDIDYSSVLLGMLVMQDVQLGLFIAVMPTLIQAGVSTYSSIFKEILRILILIGQILFSLAAVFLLCLVLKTYLIGPYYRKLHTESKGNKEILILGITAFTFLMLTITELLDVSMELGCFLAGALISSQGHMVTEEIMCCIEPIRDFLAIIFFASIGLHVFPTFVIYELTVLLFLTLSVVIMKFVLAVLVLSLILPKTSQYIKWIVSAGLAQVSEFSFVLGSRARRAGIISREVYLLILSVTTLSLLLAPALWRAAIMKCVPRPERRSST